jgi:hypothetical protein
MALRKWPGTPAERRDRDLVVDLVLRVGARNQIFTVADLRREMEAEPRLQLAHPRQLSRHVHDLDDALIVRVGQRLASGATVREGAPAKARHEFTLASRAGEPRPDAIGMTDTQRVHHALWVAIEAMDSPEVPTKTVTAVLRSVQALALHTERNTLNHLVLLGDRSEPLASRRKPDGERWTLWRPEGAKPEHPDFVRWVSAFRATGEDHREVVRTGKATLVSLAQELVAIAVRQSRSTTWPAGRPVQIADIRAVCARDERARQIHEVLTSRRAGGLGAVLGDATKERIAGRDRAVQRVVKISGGIGDAAYYDVPDEPGFEGRRLYIVMRALREEMGPQRLRALLNEHIEARSLLRAESSPGTRAAAAARRVLVWRELRPIRHLLEEAKNGASRLSQASRDSLIGYERRLDELVRDLGDPRQDQDEAEAALAAVGLSLADLLAADRPTMTPAEYVSFLPRGPARGLSAADVLHRATTLRRFPNPSFVSQRDSDPARCARYVVDRAEALHYLATRDQGAVFGLLNAGMRLLGRDLRYSALARVLAEEAGPKERRAGLGALVLLGDSEAPDMALRHIQCAATPAAVVDALHALIVTRSVEPSRWPPKVLQSRDRMIRDAVTQVVLASRSGRWLLQR